MAEQLSKNNFGYFQKYVYTAVCAQYVELWDGATENTFVCKMFSHMMLENVSGDEFVKHCIQKNSMYREDFVIIACGYLAEATKAKAKRLDDLAWTYLMDAQRYISFATYARHLRRNIPEMEAQFAEEALKSSKRKGGEKTNEVGRIIGDKAVELIKMKGAQGQPWLKVRDAVRAIKSELLPFMEQKDPGRSKDNYERSVVDRLKKNHSEEIAQFVTEMRHRKKIR